MNSLKTIAVCAGIFLAHNAMAQNVGIGTNTPTEKLHVVGGARIENLSGTGYRLVQANGTGVLSTILDGTSGQVLTTNGAGVLSFQTLGGNNTLDMAYDEGGPGAGRIITADAGTVEINGTGGLWVNATTSTLSDAVLVNNSDGTNDAQIKIGNVGASGGNTYVYGIRSEARLTAATNIFDGGVGVYGLVKHPTNGTIDLNNTAGSANRAIGVYGNVNSATSFTGSANDIVSSVYGSTGLHNSGGGSVTGSRLYAGLFAGNGRTLGLWGENSTYIELVPGNQNLNYDAGIIGFYNSDPGGGNNNANIGTGDSYLSIEANVTDATVKHVVLQTRTTGNVGIGTATPSEKLHVDGGTRITSLSGTGNRLVQSNATGVLSNIADGTSGQVLTTDGAGTLSFQTPAGSSTAWELLGNAGTVAGTNFLGTTDAQDLVFKTNDTENMRINTSGNIDVGAGFDDARIYARVMNTDAVTNYGLYVYHDGAAAGNTYGTRTINYSSTNSVKYGIFNYTNNEGTGGRYGIYNNTYLNSASNATAYGIRNYVSVYGTATQYGMYNYLTSTTATGVQYGQYTAVYLATANSSNSYGEYITMDYSSGARYGEYKYLNTNATYDGSVYGDYNRIYGSGDGLAYGDYNRVEVTGTGTKYGGYNIITGSGTGTKYGSYNNISPTGSGTQYAVYNSISATNTSSKYGVYNNFANVDGAKYGLYNYFANGTATGTIYGLRNSIYSDGNATKYGVYNIISGGDGSLRGTYTTITPATTNSSTIYGVFSSVSSNGTGTHYGVYSTASGGTNDYSGMFYAGNFVANEIGGDYDFRVETDTRTSALHVDAGNNVVRVGSATGALTGNTTTVAGVVVDYLVDFDNSSATGTAIGIGSVEYLLDGINETTINNTFSPTTDLNRDLGNNGGTARYWDDVYADDYWVPSDVRLKDNIKELSYGLKEIMELEAISYVLKADPFQEPKIGLKAQQTLNLVPEAVKTHEHKALDENNPEVYSEVEMDRMAMSYQTLVPVLVNAVQEQQEQIDALKEEIKLLKEERK